MLSFKTSSTSSIEPIFELDFFDFYYLLFIIKSKNIVKSIISLLILKY